MAGSALDLVPWLLLGIPIVSMVRWADLSQRKRTNYANYVEWMEFPIRKIAPAKLLLFLSVGLGSIILPVVTANTMVALVAIGLLGYLLELTFVSGRPLPTPGYRITKVACQNCSVAAHEKCTNMRMLDGYERKFRGEGGVSRPVCCCGFRLGEWEEVETPL